ncbi:MAG: ArsR/SmtB family transcription factor [Inquilinaceae bacterium]
MDEVLRALADGTRRRILALVWSEERTAGDIAGHFDVSRPAVSQHLRVLLDSGLVAVRPEGTKRLYRADRGSLQAVRALLEDFWDDGLARLKAAAEQAERETRS